MRPELIATYRLQLCPGFGFDEARALIPYLKRLGVSHVYTSPYLQAAAGSNHGYDVVDPTRVNEELGGAEKIDDIEAELAVDGIEGYALLVDHRGDGTGWGGRSARNTEDFLILHVPVGSVGRAVETSLHIVDGEDVERGDILSMRGQARCECGDRHGDQGR